MAFSNSVTCAKRNKKLMTPSIVGFTDSIMDAKVARCYIKAAVLFHSTQVRLKTFRQSLSEMTGRNNQEQMNKWFTEKMEFCIQITHL